MFEYAKSIWWLVPASSIHHSWMDLKPLSPTFASFGLFWPLLPLLPLLASFMEPLASETDNRPTTVLILANDSFLLGPISTLRPLSNVLSLLVTPSSGD